MSNSLSRLSAFGVAAAIHVLALITLTWLASDPQVRVAERYSFAIGSASSARYVTNSSLRTSRRRSANAASNRSATAGPTAGVIVGPVERVLNTVNTAAVNVAVRIGLVDPRRVDAELPDTTNQVVFGTVSIKANSAGHSQPSRTIVEPGGRFVAENVALAQLIGDAYQLHAMQLVSGPRWIWSDTFDIDAIANGELLPKDGWRPLQGALRGLLADDFGLVAHIEMMRLPPYALQELGLKRLRAIDPVDLLVIDGAERPAEP